jgi:MoaA/NifB/PqqE/SkfB family radical SAM enzyme
MAGTDPVLRFLWLEITGRCQLECGHCYAASSPRGDHGRMSTSDWRQVIDDAARQGCEMVQFIGGEPTTHPNFVGLADHALAAGLRVEVFSNLIHVRDEHWRLFGHPGVTVATSYYSDQAPEHDTVTGRRGSHQRTRASLCEAVRRGVPIRVGIVQVADGQRVGHARRELSSMGVTEIAVDRVRQVGRGVRDQQPGAAQLCGGCADGKAAVAPDGTVWPGVFSRWLPVGNVLEQPLSTIVAGPRMASTRAMLADQFPPTRVPCPPDMCDPQCGPSCSPACIPAGNCRPAGGCAPDHRRSPTEPLADARTPSLRA